MTDFNRDRLSERLGRAAPQPPDLARLASVVEHRAQRRRTTRRGALIGATAVSVAVAVVLPLSLAAQEDRTTTDTDNATPAPPLETPPGPDETTDADPPDACVRPAEAARETIEGTPVWVRFCPGRDGYTAPAEAPSDALVTHLDLLAGLAESPKADSVRGEGCDSSFGRRYRLQIGFAEGGVAQLSGRTDPGCASQLTGSGGTLVRGPDDLGVYGAAMSAFGRQYADGFAAPTPHPALACPADPRDPDSVDLDGASASLDTGYHLGERAPMLMPLTAVRGIVCTWPPGSTNPTIRDLTAEQAERVRIGLHAIAGGMVDCGGSPEKPTVSAIVEDKTGTRRAVTIIESECSTVIRSDDGFGLGFAWLDQ